MQSKQQLTCAARYPPAHACWPGDRHIELTDLFIPQRWNRDINTNKFLVSSQFIIFVCTPPHRTGNQLLPMSVPVTDAAISFCTPHGRSHPHSNCILQQAPGLVIPELFLAAFPHTRTPSPIRRWLGDAPVEEARAMLEMRQLGTCSWCRSSSSSLGSYA